ncbi:MAG: hypothetical protein PHR06_10170 [Candidatus Cloacimonetes bacterium]|nr:hypothetical protein [Candidatus Cloacimonadota bacterium]
MAQILSFPYMLSAEECSWDYVNCQNIDQLLDYLREKTVIITTAEYLKNSENMQKFLMIKMVYNYVNIISVGLREDIPFLIPAERDGIKEVIDSLMLAEFSIIDKKKLLKQGIELMKNL